MDQNTISTEINGYVRILLAGMIFILAVPAAGQGIVTTLPDEIDVETKYVFYLPDDIVTPKNPEPSHPEFGKYQYLQIANQFMAAGFTVVTRPREAVEHAYLVAEEIADQIQRLLAAGVSAENIGIVGAGKGGTITVLVASRLSNPGLQVVVLSLCNETFVEYWIKSNELLAGNVLSIYASGVADRGPCASYLQHCAKLNVREHREIALPESSGAGFYYRASGEWMLPAIEWLRGHHAAVTEQGLVPPDVRKPE